MPVELKFALLFVAAYLVGSVPVAYLVAKWTRGIDLRQRGSGQVGASNVVRSVSRPAGVLVGIYDVGKGALMVWLAQLWGFPLGAQIAVGAATVVGHNWPVFLRFNAGRGLATSVGVILFLFPWAVILYVICVLIAIFVGSSPIPFLLGIAATPLMSWLMQYFGRPQPLTLTLGLIVFLVIMVVRRLTAPRTVSLSAVSTRDLLINRFFFDRDLRDGRAWIKRKREEVVTNKPG